MDGMTFGSTVQRLVVIGNGMAGARAVEEVLARGGAEQFTITMFGDEPYGNYNRILLSNILSGQQDTSEIYINPLSWYKENNIRLHSGARVTHIDRAARIVTADNGIQEEYDILLIATGSRAFIRRWRASGPPTASCAPASLPSAALTTAPPSSRRPPRASAPW